MMSFADIRNNLIKNRFNIITRCLIYLALLSGSIALSLPSLMLGLLVFISMSFTLELANIMLNEVKNTFLDWFKQAIAKLSLFKETEDKLANIEKGYDEIKTIQSSTAMVLQSVGTSLEATKQTMSAVKFIRRNIGSLHEKNYQRINLLESRLHHFGYRYKGTLGQEAAKTSATLTLA